MIKKKFKKKDRRDERKVNKALAKQILGVVKENGGATVYDIISQIGHKRTYLLTYLLYLEKKKKITGEPIHDGSKGRPRKLWRIK